MENDGALVVSQEQIIEALKLELREAGEQKSMWRAAALQFRAQLEQVSTELVSTKAKLSELTGDADQSEGEVGPNVILTDEPYDAIEEEDRPFLGS